MVDIPPQMLNSAKYIASFFQVKPEWLFFPNVVTIFAIPLVLNVLMMYYVLQRVIKIFPGSINWMIGGIVGFLLLPYNNYTMLVAPLAIGFLGPRRWPFKILVAALLYAIQFVVIPLIFEGVTRLPFFK